MGRSCTEIGLQPRAAGTPIGSAGRRLIRDQMNAGLGTGSGADRAELEAIAHDP